MASHITIVHRRDAFRDSKIMADRALAADNISVRWHAVVDDVLGDERVEAVRVRDVVTGETEDIPAVAMFVAIGHDPSTALFRGQIDLDPEGYVLTGGGTRTSVDGVFACGDVQDRTYRQAVTAAGSGCMAAMDAERWLETAAHTAAATAGA